MNNENPSGSPISDDEFSRELGKLTGQIRRKHFLGVLSEGLPLCVHCGESIFNSEAFCDSCGKQNPNYDEAQFELEMGKTVVEIRAQEGCPDTHEALRQGLRHDEELKPREGKMYCAECGALVDINE